VHRRFRQLGSSLALSVNGPVRVAGTTFLRHRRRPCPQLALALALTLICALTDAPLLSFNALALVFAPDTALNLALVVCGRI
jgi:hypothetical protein